MALMRHHRPAASAARAGESEYRQPIQRVALDDLLTILARFIQPTSWKTRSVTLMHIKPTAGDVSSVLHIRVTRETEDLSALDEPQVNHMQQYWFHYRARTNTKHGGIVVHAENCRHHRKSRLARVTREPAARDGDWLGPFTEVEARLRLRGRTDCYVCPSCCPPAWPDHPNKDVSVCYGPRRVLSAAARHRWRAQPT